MAKVHFEWDSRKDKLNRKKHNVSFSLELLVLDTGEKEK